MALQGEGPGVSWRSLVMAGSARRIATDCSRDFFSSVWFPRSFLHTSVVPSIRPISKPLNPHLSGVIAEALRPQSQRVSKAGWAYSIRLTWSICASLASKAVTTQFSPYEGVTAKMVRQCVHRDSEKSPTCCQTRSVCPTSLITDTFLTHNSPPNGRHSSCLPFLLSV
jgi:hypothetical protein